MVSMNKFLTIIILFTTIQSFSQKVKIYGTISNLNGETVPGITIRVDSSNIFAVSDPQGYYELKVPANQTYKVIFSSVSFGHDTLFITVKDKSIRKDVSLNTSAIGLDAIYKIANSVDVGGMERISSRNLTVLPDISGNAVETIIKMGMGVSSNNELSAQYNVRGGNFDENLIYVNDIQIYRPFLVRSGQQEGMSFINPDLVSSIKFSAGGFEAKYDDKMSSVLDITYKIPTQFSAGFGISLLGGSAHIENLSKNQKFSTIAGFRYKRSRYLFNTFEVSGDYQPVFADFQTYSTYKFTKKFSISILGNIASNVYNFVPSFSRSEFGTFSERLMLNVGYDGQEKDKYQTLFGAITLDYKINNNLKISLLSSSFYTNEAEKFDILAVYSLNEAARQSDTAHNAGDSILNLGYGAYLKHARNYLNAFINNASVKISWNKNKHIVKSGLKFQNEQIIDQLSEWKYIDSAGYSTNAEHLFADDKIYLYKSTKASNSMITNRLSWYLQDNFNFFAGLTKIKVNAGVRVAYNDYNDEVLISPRVSTLISPDWDKKWYFRFSTGVYYQPPFYREIRKFDGSIVENKHSQRSIHFVFGAYNTLKIWQRPFKLSSEFYYKKLDYLIPYELDNLRIRYYADETSHGYAAGADFKLYGEFVPGTDSWISLSLLKTMEDIEGDFYYEYLDKEGNPTNNVYDIVDTVVKYPGYIPRPSDQRVNIGLFFQDYIPGHENFKVNFAYYFGTPVPFGQPEQGRYLAVIRSAFPYIRGDIGFSFLLKSPQRIYPSGSFWNAFNDIWLQIEIFNFMGIRNIAAYDFVEIVPNTANFIPVSYEAIVVPNRLTGRLINFKFVINFR